jgi:putative protease
MELALGHVRGQGHRKDKEKSLQIGMMVYGRPPLFTARLRAKHFRFNTSFASPRAEQFVLDHRQDLTMARSRLPYSLLSHLNTIQSLGMSYLYADVSTGHIKKELALFASLLRNRGQDQAVLEGNFAGELQ